MIEATRTYTIDVHLRVPGNDLSAVQELLEAAAQDLWFALRHENYEIVEVGP